MTELTWLTGEHTYMELSPVVMQSISLYLSIINNSSSASTEHQHESTMDLERSNIFPPADLSPTPDSRILIPVACLSHRRQHHTLNGK